MGTAAEALAAGGLPRAEEIVAAANRAGLELAVAATMLEMESDGRNVWGHDDVDPRGAYVKGGPVTEANYRAYLKIRGAKHERSQGVGPCQLTYWTLQDLADRRGGCWRWEVNVAVGFEHLAGLVRTHGLPEAFRAYNGAGAPARAYRDKAAGKLAVWRLRLAGTGRPRLRPGDRGPLVELVQRRLGVEPASGWYGPVTEGAVRRFQAAQGLDQVGEVGPRTWAALDA